MSKPVQNDKKIVTMALKFFKMLHKNNIDSLKNAKNIHLK